MADALITPDRLTDLVGPVDTAKATVAIEAATAAVQGLVEQRLVYVADDVAEGLLGDLESWFELPERPVSAVTSVALDGEAVTDYKRFGARLWRRCGWETCPGEPSSVDVVYTHGYQADDPRLAPAQSAVLMLAAQILPNPGGNVASERVGDYQIAYDAAVSILNGSKALRDSLLRRYGRRVGHVRQGA